MSTYVTTPRWDQPAGTGLLRIDIQERRPGTTMLVPMGFVGANDGVASLTVNGAEVRGMTWAEGHELGALMLHTGDEPITLTYVLRPGNDTYPATVFTARDCIYTRAAPELAQSARELTSRSNSADDACLILARETASRFFYGHPKKPFTKGLDVVPYLSCGLTPGSCVDIHGYFIAMARAAGLQAGYLYGTFFDANEKGESSPGHCWCVTRTESGLIHWDISHWLKYKQEIWMPGLNPAPGARIALGHSMSHYYAIGSDRVTAKLLSGPSWLEDGELRLARAARARRLPE